MVVKIQGFKRNREECDWTYIDGVTQAHCSATLRGAICSADGLSAKYVERTCEADVGHEIVVTVRRNLMPQRAQQPSMADDSVAFRIMTLWFSDGHVEDVIVQSTVYLLSDRGETIECIAW